MYLESHPPAGILPALFPALGFGTMTRVASMTLAAALLLVQSAQPALAQSDDQSAPQGKGPRVQGAGFFSLGTSFTGIGDLNDRLELAGYPTFGRVMLSIGGGGYGVHGGTLMIGGEGYGLRTGGQTHQGRDISVGGGYGFFNMGYLLRPAPRLRMYPMLGIGGGALNMDIGSTGDADSFDDVLQVPDREARLRRASLLLSLGGGIEYGFGKIGLGLRAGYVIAPYTANWRLGGRAIDDSPDASLAGPFVRLLIVPRPRAEARRVGRVSATSRLSPQNVNAPYRPPTSAERFRWYLGDAFGPIALFRASLGTGFSHASNEPPEWERNAGGLARRFGSHAGELIIQETTRYALGPVVDEDTYYYRCDCTGFFPRLGHALLSTFTARARDGHRRFSVVNTSAPFVGALAAVGLWYPDGYGAGDGFREGGLAVAGSAGTNILREFLFPPRKRAATGVE